MNEEERDGEFVASKIFYQTQPRQHGNSINNVKDSYEKIINKGSGHGNNSEAPNNAAHVECYNACYTNYDHMHVGYSRESTPQLIIPNMAVQGDGTIIHLSMDHANKVRVLERK